jgi:hypothetical protein
MASHLAHGGTVDGAPQQRAACVAAREHRPAAPASLVSRLMDELDGAGRRWPCRAASFADIVACFAIAPMRQVATMTRARNVGEHRRVGIHQLPGWHGRLEVTSWSTRAACRSPGSLMSISSRAEAASVSRPASEGRRAA